METKLLDQTPSTEVVKSEVARFLADCRLNESPKPDCLPVDPRELASFCRRWLGATEFKFVEEGEDRYRPITAEMNGLRVSMIEDLVARSGAPLEGLEIDLTP